VKTSFKLFRNIVIVITFLVMLVLMEVASKLVHAHADIRYPHDKMSMPKTLSLEGILKNRYNMVKTS
jgi:hypothetical protein